MLSSILANLTLSPSANAKNSGGAFQCATPSLNDSLQNSISRVTSEMNGVNHWNFTVEEGRAKYAAELIPLLITSGQYTLRADGKSDMQEAEELSKKLMGEMQEEGISGFVPAYFKSAGKAYRAMVYLAKINDGKISANEKLTVAGKTMTVADYAIKLCGEAYYELKNPSSATESAGEAASAAPAGITGGVRKLKKGGASSEKAAAKKGSTQEHSYYLMYLVRITEAKLMDIRRGAGDTDKAIGEIYEEVKDVNVSGLNITGATEADKRRKTNGIIWLKALAKAERASIYVNEQDAVKVQTGIDLLREAISELEDLDTKKMTPADKVDLSNKGEKPPKTSFDYFRARLLLADLLVKKAALTGDETLLTEANGIYEGCANVTFDSGAYRCYIASWSAVGSINRAVSFDQLHMLYQGMGKKDAINQAIENLAAARAKLPADKYLAMQSKLLEANLRLMATRGVSQKAVDLAQEVIAALNGVNNPESKADLEARASLVLGRAIALKTQNDPDPEDKITTLRSAIVKLNDAANAAARYATASGNKKALDESFYSELLHTNANLKMQLAAAVRNVYEDLEDAGSADAKRIKALKDEYIALLAEIYNEKTDPAGNVTAKSGLFVDALARCSSNKNHSKYDINVRTQVIKLEIANFQAFQITTKKTGPGIEAADIRLKKLNKILGSLSVTLPSGSENAEQANYLSSLQAKTKINLIAAKLFLMNSNDMPEGDIAKAYSDMNELEAAASAGLTASEMFFVYQTMLGASMAMLRFTSARASALEKVGHFYSIMKNSGTKLSYEMAEAFAVYATSGIINEKEVAEYVVASLEKIKTDSESSIKDKARRNRIIAKVIVKIGDMQSWILAKLPGNKLDVKILDQARKNYSDAVSKYGDTSLLSASKAAQVELILALDTDIRKDVINDAERKTIATARMKRFQTALTSLQKVINTSQSPNAMDRGDFGGKDAQARIMANQWVGIIYFSLADMLDLGLITGAQAAALTGIKDVSIISIVQGAKVRFDEAITVYDGLRDTAENALTAAQKAELGINIASIYANKANAIATWALNTTDVQKRVENFNEVRTVINTGVEKAQKEKDRISEGTLMIMRANLLYWEGGSVAEAVTEYEKGFMMMTGKGNMADIAKSDYLGISFRDLYNYADAKAIASYTNADTRAVATALLKRLIELDGGKSVYSALAYSRLGDMTNAITDEQHADRNTAIKSFKTAREYFCKALDILNNTTLGDNVSKHINLIKGLNNPFYKNRNVVETASMLMETETRLFLAENNAGQIKEADKQKRWEAELAILDSSREIVRVYIEKALKVWEGSDNIRDLKDVVDSRIKESNKDLARRLRKVVIWRTELIYAGCDAAAGIRSDKACNIVGEGSDYRESDRPVNNPEARY